MLFLSFPCFASADDAASWLAIPPTERPRPPGARVQVHHIESVVDGQILGQVVSVVRTTSGAEFVVPIPADALVQQWVAGLERMGRAQQLTAGLGPLATG